MKTRKTYFVIFSFVLILMLTPMPAEAAGWTDADDGWTTTDQNGCLVYIHTQEWRLFGITWDTRIVVDTIWCPSASE
jgi:hypothetical protein